MPRLIFMPFLQQWDGAHLSLNLLAAPQYSPLDPLVPGAPSFTDADFTFAIRLVQGLASMPTTASPFTAIEEPTTAPARSRAICAALAAQLPIDASVIPVDPRLAGRQFLKYAPPGYRAATGYADGGNPYLRIDDSYHCVLKSGVPAGTVLKSDPPKLGWGKVLASALRQPLLAENIGLVRRFTLTPAPGFFDAGGWIYLTLAAAGPGAAVLAMPDGLKSYAARVPPLAAARSLFTSVVFPVAVSIPAADYDDMFREVLDYDDGFAKAVYAAQPTVLDPLGEEDDGTRPRTDHGIRLGWDDEQVATWLNRQVAPAAAAADAPMGVLGYRVDAREAGTTAWHSLVMGTTAVKLNGLDLGSYTGEFRVEVAPNKLMADPTDTFWIPSYYTGWTGPSLVAFDRAEAQLGGVDKPSVVQGIDPDIDLRYGHTYEFRVRLVDHTGGGPALTAQPANPAPQPLAPWRFVRWVQPPPLRVNTALPVTPDPAHAPDTITVRRPRLGYPAYVMAGGSKTDLLADLAGAAAEHRAVGLPDPDVDAVEIEVSVAFPGASGGYRVLYRTTRSFPPRPDDPLVLHLDWRDTADATTLAASAAGPLPLPTARTVRISLNALAADRANYYGSPDVRQGPQTTLAVAKDSNDGSHLLAPALADPVKGLFLQPDAAVTPAVALSQRAAGDGLTAPNNALGRLAAALDLDGVGTGLRARPGQRVLFGCSPGVAHTLGPDGGSIQFSSVNDLTLVWIVAVRLELRRDWSWDALDHVRIEQGGAEVGRVEARRTVAHEALAGAPVDRSEIVFFDVFDPKDVVDSQPPPGPYPTEPERHYTVTPVFRHTPGTVDPELAYELHLPVTTPPRQIPKLASAGLALSPYTPGDSGYHHTAPRQKVLWLEFAEPPQNPSDAFYARVLAYAPDPVLTRVPTTPAPPEQSEPPIPLDPEPIRTIVPGQSDDRAGASAMQVLQRTESPVHFFVPLPPGLTADSPELFGFFTYELRVGHAVGWSTAQGRFGRPLRVTGVQHPAPTLVASVVRSKQGIEITAPVANPVNAGASLLPAAPATQLWVLLYAQVHQADNAGMRNVLLGNNQIKADAATTIWPEAEIERLLARLGMGPETPLSCVVVETLPGKEPVANPVSADLGYERFLRTSPLTAIPAQC